MLKTLTTAAGTLLLVSSFAFAGQAPAKPVEQRTVTQSQQSQTHKQKGAKKHHRHHKKHHTPATKK
jgi:hypothetical protein